MTEADQQQAKAEEARHNESCPHCYCMGAGPAFSRFARMFEPPGEASHHFRQARLEILKGIRELLDYRIETLSRANAKGTKVSVD